nr:retrovirus-related Pol polyprotein from transposon TNT 1-94 [Tanacetum cinerariifolium]
MDGQAIPVDEDGNPLKKVEYPGDYDSEDEVASADNDMARSMASERVGFGTQSLLEQWRDSYDLLMDGQAIPVDEDGNPLKTVEYPGDYDSEDEVASADNNMARSMASERVGHIAWNCTQQKRPQNSEYFKDKMLLMQAQENRVTLDAEQLLFLTGGQENAFDDDVDEQPIQDLALNVDNVFQFEDCDAFDLDVDEAPTAQTMFMANLSSANPITDEAGPSYDLDILSEVQDHDQYLDADYAHHEEHVMHDSVQLDYVMDLHADYTSVSNMILYDQHVKDNEVPVVHNDVSSVSNDAFMMIYNDMCEPSAPSVSKTSRNTVVKNSLTAELATYRKQVELPRPHHNELNKVAIGYKNPMCLTRAKQAQPTMYDGHEILKDNHAPAKVHNTEDTLEIAEITRKKMNAKMTDPECVTRKVKIAPHDYSKENFLATFTPQKQLTPEQIYWSNDLMKLKSEALKERTKVSRPIKAFTVITPTGLTEGERGFEQTKACYLQEVIPFFKTVKDNFEGIQKALTKEVKEMKDVFEELEVEVAQYSQITQLTDQITNLQAQNDRFRAENDKIKQHYKELYDSINITRAKHIELVTKLTTKNVTLKTSVSKDKVKPQVLTRAKYALDVDLIVPRLRNNRDAHLDYLRHLKKSVETIRDIVEEAKVAVNNELKSLPTLLLLGRSKLLFPNPLIGVTRCPKASGLQPKSNPKTNRITQAKGVNKLPVED